MGDKRCPKCGKVKGFESFNKEKARKDGFRCYCRECEQTLNKKWRQDNPDVAKRWNKANAERLAKYYHEYHKANAKKKSAYDRQRYLDDKEKILKQKELYRIANGEKIREYARKKYAEDINHRLAVRLRIRVWFALKGVTRGKSATSLLGCSMQDFRNHLASKFTDGMTWENYGDWHIDHILPCASFDLSDIEQQKICFNYKNMQPLWASENQSKGCRVHAS